jgi:sodium/potassium-transporting ATPase subunit alpha
VGLTREQAHTKNKTLGDNLLTEKGVIPWYIMFLKEMTGFFSLLLWGGSALCFVAYGI